MNWDSFFEGITVGIACPVTAFALWASYRSGLLRELISPRRHAGHPAG
jgi:hypothetical protein